MTYTKAKGMLNGRSSVKLDYNTRIHPTGKDISLRFYQTDIAVFKPDGSILVDCQGIRSKSTKDRLNDYLPFKINQKDGEWFWDTGQKFQDGQIITKNLKIK
jgi:hypothetical protein